MGQERRDSEPGGDVAILGILAFLGLVSLLYVNRLRHQRLTVAAPETGA